ncbi:hypothetical protein YC2023_018038 [Brassica napus]
MFLINSEAESFLDYETKEPKEIITQDCKNLTSKAQLEETSDDYSPRLLKRPGMDSLSPLPRFKVRKEKLGDRVTGLQQLVSPFGKCESIIYKYVSFSSFFNVPKTLVKLLSRHRRVSVSLSRKRASRRSLSNTSSSLRRNMTE